jgi:hypothetical protein
MCASAGQQLNIHVKIPSPSSTWETILSENQYVSSLLSNPSDQQIDFVATQDPHATLYLTTFTKESVASGALLAAAASSILSATSSPTCSSPSAPSSSRTIGSDVTASGAYGMLSVTNTDCLQLMSDALVNATNQFVEPSAKDYIPSWIYDLPEDQQQAKIDMIHAYGSPNVFASFQPHVTLVADAANTTELAAVVDTWTCQHLEILSSPIQSVGFGSVGPFGTVLKGQDVMPPIAVFAQQQ